MTNVLEMLSVQVDRAYVQSPMLDLTAKILVILPLVSHMPNVLFKIVFPCVGVCLVSNCYQCNEPALTLMNAVPPLRPVDQELFVKIPLVLSIANVLLERLVIHPEAAALAPLPKSADQTPNAGKEKLALLEPENVFVGGVMTEIPPMENAKISTSAWPVPNQSVALMLSAKICQEATSASAH